MCTAGVCKTQDAVQGVETSQAWEAAVRYLSGIFELEGSEHGCRTQNVLFALFADAY